MQLANGSTYYFKIMAMDDNAGTSNLSDEVSASPQVAGGPSISSISPASGYSGMSVTINGSNFGTSQGSSTVTFNGVSGIPSSWGDTAIVVKVPIGAATGNVVVNVNSTPSNGVLFTVTASPSIPVYQYSILQSDGTSGYQANGNIQAYTDSVNGNWGWNGAIQYDGLNRLIAASVVPAAGGTAQNWCWSYDSFGNRTQEQNSTSSLPSDCANAPGAAWNSMGYDAHNQITSTSSPLGTPTYDEAGNIKDDGSNEYKYDAEGRICAAHKYINGQLTGYIYDADGNRIAKGTISTFSCDTSTNGFTPTGSYIVDQEGHQVTEMTISNGQSSWAHTNVYTGGTLLATYDPQGLHFHISDWLGNRRVQTNAFGQVEEACINSPFGNNLICSSPSNVPATADDATEHHFTGKERDTESGLDYFGARYYGSSMGRWMSPDPRGNSVADLGNPQSWNMYAYVLNNPLKYIDPNGLDCAYLNDSGTDIENGGLDQNSNSGECKQNGGLWVDGAINNVSYNAKNDVITFSAYDQNMNSYDTSFKGSTNLTPFNADAFFGNYAAMYRQNVLAQLGAVPTPQQYIQATAQAVNQQINSLPKICAAGVAGYVGVGGHAGLGLSADTQNGVQFAGGAATSQGSSVSFGGSNGNVNYAVPIPDTPAQVYVGTQNGNLLNNIRSVGVSVGKRGSPVSAAAYADLGTQGGGCPQ